MADEEVKKPRKRTVKPKIGTVVDCMALNIRKEPNLTCEVVTMVLSGSQLTISRSGATEDFYKVSTSDGIEGYCLKQYVLV